MAIHFVCRNIICLSEQERTKREGGNLEVDDHHNDGEGHGTAFPKGVEDARLGVRVLQEQRRNEGTQQRLGNSVTDPGPKHVGLWSGERGGEQARQTEKLELRMH
jgi:hypothetical protein